MKTQAWGWLVAGVMALGLNGVYHDGGMQWAHQIADRVGNSAGAVWALASGHADEFFAKAQMASAREETASFQHATFAQGSLCRVATAIAHVQTHIARSENSFAHLQNLSANFENISAQQEAALARVEANRARMEAQREKIDARVVVRIRTVALVTPVNLRVSCPRVRVMVPRVPMVRTPMIHIAAPQLGPI